MVSTERAPSTRLSAHPAVVCRRDSTLSLSVVTVKRDVGGADVDERRSRIDCGDHHVQYIIHGALQLAVDVVVGYYAALLLQVVFYFSSLLPIPLDHLPLAVRTVGIKISLR